MTAAFHAVRAVAAAALLLCTTAALPQSDWKPSRAIEIVSGTSGGGADRMARLVQTLIQREDLVPTPVTVVTKPGAGNSIAFSYASQKPGDPHLLLVSTRSASRSTRSPGRAVWVFAISTPVCTLFDEYASIVVQADSSITSGKELIERLRKDPRRRQYRNHLRRRRQSPRSGDRAEGRRNRREEVRTVVFESAGKALLAVLGGHVDVAPTSASVPVPHLQAGTVRVLGITAPRRMSGALSRRADVEGTRRPGGFSSYRGFSAPKDLPPGAIAYSENVFGAIDSDRAGTKRRRKTFCTASFARAAKPSNTLGSSKRR